MNHAICSLQWSLSFCTQRRLKKGGKSTNNFSSSTILTFLIFSYGVFRFQHKLQPFLAVWLRCAPSTRRRPWLQIHPASGTPCVATSSIFMIGNTRRKKISFDSGSMICLLIFSSWDVLLPKRSSPFRPHIPVELEKPKVWKLLFLTIHLLLGIIISAFRQVLKWLYSYYMLLDIITEPLQSFQHQIVLQHRCLWRCDREVGRWRVIMGLYPGFLGLALDGYQLSVCTIYIATIVGRRTFNSKIFPDYVHTLRLVNICFTNETNETLHHCITFLYRVSQQPCGDDRQWTLTGASDPLAADCDHVAWNMAAEPAEVAPFRQTGGRTGTTWEITAAQGMWKL